ncbi:porin [Marinoscillum sp.]|uniref:porin n=1 Tax=Marinoscillum sp. TaxID=2024838 RepID=UPI003BA8562A
MFYKKFVRATIVVCSFLCSHISNGQIIVPAEWGKRLYLQAEDSSFNLKFGFRFQSLYQGIQNLENDTYDERAMIRRCRLKFDGYAFHPNIIYKLELAVSNRDQRSGHIPEMGNTSNIVLDALVRWKFAKGWELWAGQTKLPGNRERVVSSQNLQFVDRSLVNSRFTLDRDIGLQLRKEHTVSGVVFREILALSMGEGRNVIGANPRNGHEFTGRVEILPFGKFNGKEDFIGADLTRHKSPKLSVAISYDYNQDAPRSRGNLGGYLTDTNGEYIYSDLSTLFVDAVFKYRGFSWNAEYVDRRSSNNSDGFGNGRGFVTAAGYVTKPNIEIALRYTDVQSGAGASSISDVSEYTLGVSKYIKGHSLKVQSDMTYRTTTASNFMMYRLQFEVAL